MSVLLLIVLFSALPFPILAAIEIVDQYGGPYPSSRDRCRTDGSH